MPTEEYRVIGPPGCGKTTFLAREVERAAQSRGSESVLVTSLTRTAAAKVAMHDLPIPEENVGTLHAHAWRACGRPKIFEDPKHIKAWNEEHAGLAVTADSAELDEASVDGIGVGRTDGDRLMSDLNLMRARMIAPELWPQNLRLFNELFALWKWKNNLLDFTDLIEHSLEDTLQAPSAPSIVFADETQDYSRLELSLLRKWSQTEAGVERLIVVGDPDQNLYEWRGSDPRAFQDPPIPVEQTRVLKQSYRVPVAVHAEAVAWISRTPGRTPVEYLPRDVAGTVTHEDLRLSNPADLVRAIERDLAQNKTVMVLATCAYMLQATVTALREAALPFHNPYRPSRGDWNPLRRREGSSVTRLLAYLRSQEETWGAEMRDWTGSDLRAWTGALKGLLVNDKGEHPEGTFRGLPNDESILVDELLALFKDPAEAMQAWDVLSGDYSWFESHLNARFRETMRYPLAVARKRGGKVLREAPRITVGTVHCSPPDELIATKRGPVPIADLQPSDRLLAYHRETHSVFGVGDHPNARAYSFERSERAYAGHLVTIETRESKTRVTPNHRVLVKFDDETFCERWLVYMMRRGDWWRVGICTSAHRPYRSGGVPGRLATEQADAGWVLSVHDTREGALMAEAIIQGKFGVPGLTFETAKARSFSRETLHAVHEMTAASIAPRAKAALEELGLSPEWPLYRRGEDDEGKGKRNMRGWFVTEAANLVPLSGRICAAVFTGGEKVVPQRAAASLQPYLGTVYGLDVPPHHYYISGGAIVHNSVKGEEAQVVYLAPDLSRAGMIEWSGAQQAGRDAVRRVFYVGMTRAMEELRLCAAGSPWAVQWDQ